MIDIGLLKSAQQNMGIAKTAALTPEQVDDLAKSYNVSPETVSAVSDALGGDYQEIANYLSQNAPEPASAPDESSVIYEDDKYTVERKSPEELVYFVMDKATNKLVSYHPISNSEYQITELNPYGGSTNSLEIPPADKPNLEKAITDDAHKLLQEWKAEFSGAGTPKESAEKQAASYGDETVVYEDDKYKLYWHYTAIGYYYGIEVKATGKYIQIPVQVRSSGNFGKDLGRAFGINRDDADLDILVDRVQWGDIPAEDVEKLKAIIEESGTQAIQTTKEEQKPNEQDTSEAVV